MQDHSEAKLPQWAQRKLQNLRAEVEKKDRQLRAADTPAIDTNVFIHDWVDGERGLPKDTNIVFVDATGQKLRVGLSQGHLQVSAVNGRVVASSDGGVNVMRLEVLGIWS